MIEDAEYQSKPEKVIFESPRLVLQNGWITWRDFFSDVTLYNYQGNRWEGMLIEARTWEPKLWFLTFDCRQGIDALDDLIKLIKHKVG